MKRVLLVIFVISVGLLVIPQTSIFGQEATSTERYGSVTKWGTQADNALLYAYKVATDTNGNLYVVTIDVGEWMISLAQANLFGWLSNIM